MSDLLAMINKSNSLPLRTQVENYWIHDVAHLGIDTISYRVEDMRLNRQLLLTEYYPSDIAKRHIKHDGTYTVYVHPTQNNIFTKAKEQILNVYSTLKGFQHTAINSFHSSFEANGTIYTVSDYINVTTLEQQLNQKVKYSENEIGVFAKSLVGALAALQYRSLSAQYIQPDTIYINKEGYAVVSAVTGFVPSESVNIGDVIYNIGLLMYAMLKGSIEEADEKVEELIANDSYSVVLCGLINRMLSPELSNRPKTLQEVQALLCDYYIKEYPCELKKPIVPEAKTNPLSSMARLASTAVVLFFGVYVLYYQPKELKIEEISMFESSQYHLAAYFGSVEAQRTLGQMYEKGQSVERDVAEAVQWYEKAAKRGDLYSQLSLGHLYKNGIDIAQDYDKTLNWFSEAAKQGSAVAQYNMGYFYYSGIGTIQDKRESLKWYEMAAEQNYENASYLVGQIYYEGDGIKKDYKQALAWFQKASAAGDSDALMVIGYLYERGYGVEQNDKMAFQWYMKAAQKGNPKAQYNIANSYEYGRGTDINLMDAMLWYKKVTEQNKFITSGEVTRVVNKINQQKHVQESKKLLVKSKKTPTKSFTVSYSKEYKTAYQYEKQKDHKNALKYYLLAAEQGEHKAQYKVGWLYQWGEKMKRDSIKAMYWYKKAAAQENIHAYYQISKLYGGNQKGNRDIPYDPHLAFQWCKKAATNGLGIAQKILGYFYEFGKGTKVDYHKALYWYEQGASQGYKMDERSLAILKKKIAME